MRPADALEISLLLGALSVSQWRSTTDVAKLAGLSMPSANRQLLRLGSAVLEHREKTVLSASRRRRYLVSQWRKKALA